VEEAVERPHRRVVGGPGHFRNSVWPQKATKRHKNQLSQGLEFIVHFCDFLWQPIS
jgi:hypothetical protein